MQGMSEKILDGKEFEVVGLEEILEDQDVEVVGKRQAAGVWRDKPCVCALGTLKRP